ncbi:MAG: hypothetical protein JWQ59_1992 [Cryobacterium sp.]|nr:hypothetical protein [Cryobacterium sp.]
MGSEQWHDLFVAAAGAAAALAGLIIVAVAGNVKEIIAIPSMASRGGTAIASLVLVAVVSVCALIPGQPDAVLGVEVLVTSAGALVVALNSGIRILAVGGSSRGAAVTKALLATAPVVLFLIGGVFLCASLGSGLYWVAAGIVSVFVVSVLNAWVLLIEILR